MKFFFFKLTNKLIQCIRFISKTNGAKKGKTFRAEFSHSAFAKLADGL